MPARLARRLAAARDAGYGRGCDADSSSRPAHDASPEDEATATAVRAGLDSRFTPARRAFLDRPPRVDFVDCSGTTRSGQGRSHAWALQRAQRATDRRAVPRAPCRHPSDSTATSFSARAESGQVHGLDVRGYAALLHLRPTNQAEVCRRCCARREMRRTSQRALRRQPRSTRSG